MIRIKIIILINSDKIDEMYDSKAVNHIKCVIKNNY